MGHLSPNGLDIYDLMEGHLYYLMGGAFISLNGWGIYDLMGGALWFNGWGTYGLNGWGNYDKVSCCLVWKYAQKNGWSSLYPHVLHETYCILSDMYYSKPQGDPCGRCTCSHHSPCLHGCMHG